MTPMMVQFFEHKEAYPDALLFFRMGDFYEMFFDDAVAAAAALDIALTKRGSHKGEDIPMCGVPVHALDGYLERMIRTGFRVAICEQMEDPAEAKRRGGSKAVVKRDVIRLVTPGTLTEETLLDARAHNYLAALAEVGETFGFAWLDMSTGDFTVQPLSALDLAAAVSRVAPGELLVPEKIYERDEFAVVLEDWKNHLTPLPNARFNSDNARRRLEAVYGVAALDAFGEFGRSELSAAGALIDYVELTQVGKLPRLGTPRRIGGDALLDIDAATRRSLALTRTLTGGRPGSLLSVIDRTVTGAGARLLGIRLAAPLTDPDAIGQRLDQVQYLVEAPDLREHLRDVLKAAPDLERALSRLSLGRGGPRDLAAIRDGLRQGAALRSALAEKDDAPAGIEEILVDLGDHAASIDRLAAALADDLPLMARDGGFIRADFEPPLDELRALRDESRRLIAELEARYRSESGVDNLKIKHNNVLGYFIEVTSRHADKMGGPFIHRQTMTNAMRFTTTELGELARSISEAADKALAVELELFATLVQEVVAQAGEIAVAAAAMARLDLATAFALLAVERRYTRPRIDRSLTFQIEGGRHPVVADALAAAAEGDFVANDCDLTDEQRLWILTGPNMAGKSTFLRQNALIVILAQMGSYVPAERAHIGVVDRLFSRVGAADDLARGRSTFMVEMVETATILNQATERSLVILDEIGRGTATFDGLSIAWATIEHLHETNRSRALFATHYHELVALTAQLDACKPYTMRVKEWQGDVVFLHEVAAGAADRSYGIHVARLAGLPSPAIVRAEQVLETLEQGEQSGAIARLAEDLPLFASAAEPPTHNAPKPSCVEAELRDLNPDDLTPLAALEALYRLRGLLED
ncbi:MAG: DNA mismatch repair protein MutS [Pseudomonadota bacterium]|nr:DNA mismatch repair protein MutS [Pseudomonadota bacterium]